MTIMTTEARIAALLASGISLAVAHARIGTECGVEVSTYDTRQMRPVARQWVWLKPGEVEAALDFVLVASEAYLEVRT